jgi:hypothetical protein
VRGLRRAGGGVSEGVDNRLKRDMTARVFAMYLVDSHGWLEEDADEMLARVKTATARRLPR